MDKQLTVIVRFSDADDLENQLIVLDVPESDQIEVLCAGWRSKEEFEEAKKSAPPASNVRLMYAEGGYAGARAHAIDSAESEYIVFPALSSTYDWENILASLADAREKDIEAVVMKSQNRKYIKDKEAGNGPCLISMQGQPQDFFQAFGDSLANLVISKALLKETCSLPCCDTCHDNVFSLALAFCGNDLMISGTASNGVKKNASLEKPEDLKKAYREDAYKSSIYLIMTRLQDVLDRDNAPLLDSYMRAISNLIKRLLLLGKKHEYRKTVLDGICDNTFALSFFQNEPPSEWKAIAQSRFTFIRWAILMHEKKKRLASYGPSDVRLVMESSVERPKVSMIVPVYNCAENLEDTIRSALNQSFADFELICVDDGSSDNSLEILKSLALEDGRMSIYSQPNMGQSVARNVGIEHARGKYVYFFDSDDLLSPDLLETAIGEIEDQRLDMVLFDATTFYESDGLMHDHDAFNTYYVRKHEYGKPAPGTVLLDEMNRNGEYRVSPCLFVAEKGIITENGLRFVPGVIHEDNAFAFEIMNCAKRAAHIKKALYRRRIREDSVMTSSKTFNNSYGYFVCAWKLLSRDYKVEPEYAEIAYRLAVTLATQMVKNAQGDLLHAKNGEDGGAYALADEEFGLYRISVLDYCRAKKAKDRLQEKNGALKGELANAKKENSRLKNRNKTLENPEKPKETGSGKGLFASLKKRHR